MRLLAVEDNKSIADIISNVGIGCGLETMCAHNEHEFKTAYDSFRPDIIVLDIVMPGMDGFEVLRFLKDSTCKSYIVILSADNTFRHMAEDIGHVYGLSIVANIPKPFRVPLLRNILEEIKVMLPKSDDDSQCKNNLS